MKTQLTLPQKQTFKTISFIGIIMITLLAFSPIYGQNKTVNTMEIKTNERTIKGLVSNEDGPLDGVNVIQKGTKNGTVTNAKGEFTFPTKLKTGDVLVFSYLGFEKQEVKITANTSSIKIVLTDDLVEMIGALDSAKPYKSKRNKN